MVTCLDRTRTFTVFQWRRLFTRTTECLSTTATTANAGFQSPYELSFRSVPPANNLAYMQPGFRRVRLTHTNRRPSGVFYLNKG